MGDTDVTGYRLDDLGWFQFERLAQSLVKAACGLAVESWGGSKDYGKDSYSLGPLRFPDPAVSTAGPFVFQAKFVAEANAAGAKPAPLLLGAVRKEVARIVQRTAAGQWTDPAVYTLLTNCPMPAAMRSDVTSELQAALPSTQIHTLDYSDLSDMLDASPALRLAYPQILGLRDLKELIAHAVAADVLNRSTIILERIKDLAPKFVATEAYNKAVDMLDRRGFVVLTGPPEMGKTAIARMISFARYTSGWDAYDCRTPSELFKTLDKSRNQVFVADDMFGSTEYRPELATEWADNLEQIFTLVDAKHWVIWTTRPAPLREGLSRLHLQGSAEKFPSLNQVQVDASRLSLEERAQILYRHAKAAGLSAREKELVRMSASDVVGSRHFTPLRIRRFVETDLRAILSAPVDQQRSLIAEAVSEGLQAPTDEMMKSFVALSDEQRALLISMLNSSYAEVNMQQLDGSFRDYLGQPSSKSTEDIVDLLEEHFLETYERGDNKWFQRFLVT